MRGQSQRFFRLARIIVSMRYQSLRAFRAFLKGTGVVATTGLVFSPVLAHSDWSLVCYSDPVDQLVKQRSGYKTPPSLDYLVPSESRLSALVSPLPPPASLAPALLSLPALPRYSASDYSSLQRKLFQEASSVLQDFQASTDVLERRLQAEGWRQAAASFFPETHACIYVKSIEIANKEVNRYVILGRAEISAGKYFHTISDLSQRTLWDRNAKQIAVQPGNSKEEISVHWITRMPWPLADRSYDFRSRLSSDGRNHAMVSVGSPDGRSSSEAVAVSDYLSVTMVREEESGCRFATYYFDDPNLSATKFPTWLETHAAKSLLPSFSLDVVTQAKEISDQQAQDTLASLAMGREGEKESDISAWERDIQKYSQSSVGCG